MKDTSTTIHTQYHVYVMRFWQDQGASRESSASWRFSIENPTTGQRRGFSSLEELFAYIENLTARESET